MRRFRVHRFYWGVAALAAVASVAMARHWKPRPRLAASTLLVPSVTAEPGEVGETLRITGSTSALRSVSLLAPRILGSRSDFNRGGDRGFARGGDFNLVLLSVAKAGTRVKEGEIVAQFDPQNQQLRLDDYKDAVVQLENNLESAKAGTDSLLEAHAQTVRSAKADWDKAVLDLGTTPVVTPIDAEKLKLTVEQNEATYQELASEASLVKESQDAQLRALQLNLQQARIEEKRAEGNVQKMTIRAPMAGYVVMASIVRNGEYGQVREGDQVNAGQPFLSIVDPSSMMLDGELNQVDAEKLRLGMKAAVKVDAYPGLDLRGVVEGVGAMAVASTFRAGYVAETPVRIRIEGADPRLLPDLSGSADVVLAAERARVVVPASAVLHENGRDFVFVRGAAGWEKRAVKPGVRSAVSVAIEGGVRAGEQVAVQPPL